MREVDTRETNTEGIDNANQVGKKLNNTTDYDIVDGVTDEQNIDPQKLLDSDDGDLDDRTEELGLEDQLRSSDEDDYQSDDLEDDQVLLEDDSGEEVDEDLDQEDIEEEEDLEEINISRDIQDDDLEGDRVA